MLTTETPAEKLLRESIAVIADRRGSYGPPGEHFAKTAAAISSVFADKLRPGESFSGADWACIMILDKLCRAQGPRAIPDNPVDVAGYAACWAEAEAPQHKTGQVVIVRQAG